MGCIGSSQRRVGVRTIQVISAPEDGESNPVPSALGTVSSQIESSDEGTEQTPDEGPEETPDDEFRNSMDSGICEGHVITERSCQELVENVNREFVERDNLNLTVTGTACPPVRSRQDEERVKQLLMEEGLLVKPATRAPGGVSFEVISTDALPEYRAVLPQILPPLQRGKERRSKRQPHVLTSQTLRDKLDRADVRRKLQEDEKVCRIRMRSALHATVAAQRLRSSDRTSTEDRLEEVT